MAELDFNHLLAIAQKAAIEAGAEIIKVYESADFEIEAKADNSPVTQADKAAHACIVQYLNPTDIPVLSEEGKNIPYEKRVNWEYFWMVDPLDGTKEFIKKNGEFTVNIALIHQNRPILGVVYTPVLQKLHYACQGKGAFLKEGDAITSLPYTPKDDSIVKIVASRSHLNEETKKFIAQYENTEILSMGSSLKFMLVAEGKANVYPRIAPTMEWDTAAAQIVVEEAGGKVLNYHTKEVMKYNKENLLNPYFIVYDKV